MANITTLLNSLHTHLQSQTQLLPGLHAQLGLPATALADELSALQEQLNACVEKQIDSRRKQVEEWMEKCKEMEEECGKYAKALGGNVKATGNTLGEIRKENVLPKRYETLANHQERLRQLYHTKLEQLTTLTNRITALSRVLGPDYYPPEIFELPLDEFEHRDVTPEKFSKLEKELVRGKAEVKKRLTQLHDTFVQIDWLYTELGMTPPVPDGFGTGSLGLSTSDDNDHDVFLSTPTPSSRHSHRTPPMFASLTPTSDDPPQDHTNDTFHLRTFLTFISRIDEAEAAALEKNPTLGLEGVEPSPSLLAWANDTRANLEDTKRRREAHIQAMYDQLEGLWRRLGATDKQMDEFVEAHRGSTEETVKAYEEELEAMLELKRNKMGQFVQGARGEIVRLWDDLMIGEEERAEFAAFRDDEFTEELLTAHEEEIARLKEEKRVKAPLLGSIQKYFKISEEENELAALASDQSRLLGRGRRDPGRLLKEEKMRNRVTKEKPRLEQDLLASIPAWEAETGRTFLVHGESILQILMQTAAATIEKENKRRPKSRSGSIPPRSRTTSTSSTTQPPNPIPTANVNSFAPGRPRTRSSSNNASASTSSTGVVTPAVRPSSSLGASHYSNPPNKRARLGDSTSSMNNYVGYTPGQSRNLGSSRDRPPSPPATRLRSHSKATRTPSTMATPASTVSSLPRPVARHGRVPSSGQSTAQKTLSRIPSTSFSFRSHGHMPPPAVNVAAVMKKSSRARRESFKPRPSEDVVGASGY